MKMTAHFKLPSFDDKAYRAALHDKMSQEIQDAARAWLYATATQLIPVWSGASVATFLHLAKAALVHLNTTPSVTSFYRNGRAYGESRSGPTNPITYGPNRYEFTYETTLKHLIFNELHNANAGGDPAVFFRLINPGPYHFQQAGQRAFREFARTVRLPNPLRSIRTKSLRVT